MARPGISKILPPKEILYSKVKTPYTKQRPEHRRPREESPSEIDKRLVQGSYALQMLKQDMEFDPKQIKSDNHYNVEYVKMVSVSGFSPLDVLYCNYCWNNWPVIGVFAMDKLTMQRFLRGQCCPYCEKSKDRPNLTESLHRVGPSHFAISQAQTLGMRTDRFPYVGVDDGPIRFQDIWSVNAMNVAVAREWWDRIRDSVKEINPNL